MLASENQLPSCGNWKWNLLFRCMLTFIVCFFNTCISFFKTILHTSIDSFMCVLQKFMNSACGLRSCIVYRSPVWILNLLMPSFWRSSHHCWNFYSNKISSFQWPLCHYFSPVSRLNLMANQGLIIFLFFQ